jgi:hypothetical protein
MTAFLLVLVILLDDGRLRFIVKPVPSQAHCVAAVAAIVATRPSAIQMHECIDISKLAGVEA